MIDIKISGRKVSVTDEMRDAVEEKIGGALKVFHIEPMTCDVVLRVGKNHSNPDRCACEVTVFVRGNVVRAVTEDADMLTAIEEAAKKVSRQLRRYKTRVIDKRLQDTREAQKIAPTSTDALADLIEPEVEEDDQLIREKFIEMIPMTEEQALIQTDLLGHDFFVFENATTGLTNVIYHRNNGGYGIIKPRLEESDE